MALTNGEGDPWTPAWGVGTKTHAPDVVGATGETAGTVIDCAAGSGRADDRRERQALVAARAVPGCAGGRRGVARRSLHDRVPARLGRLGAGRLGRGGGRRGRRGV